MFEISVEAGKYVFDPHVHALAVAAVYTSTWHRRIAGPRGACYKNTQVEAGAAECLPQASRHAFRMLFTPFPGFLVTKDLSPIAPSVCHPGL